MAKKSVRGGAAPGHFHESHQQRARLALFVCVLTQLVADEKHGALAFVSSETRLRQYGLRLSPRVWQVEVASLCRTTGRVDQMKRRESVVMMGRRAAKNAARKGKSDAAKAKLYARAGKKIVMAVKAGGPDVVANSQLAQIIKDAKTQGVPVANIERAIKSGSSTDTADFKESTFEGYGYGGAGLIVNVLTDNANRASADIQSTMKKRNIKLASPGSVLFNFERRGKITLKASNDLDEDAVLELALEAGLDDFSLLPGDDDDTSIVITELDGLSNMQSALSDAGHAVLDANLAYVPLTTVQCSDDDLQSNFAAIEALEDLDDVDSVDHNMDLDD